MDRLRRFPRQAVIFLIELYRSYISPMRLPTCRFEPTCSGYAVEALDRHGFFYGGLLAVLRLLKCGPWHKPGYHPVPEHGLWTSLRLRWGRASESDQSSDSGQLNGSTASGSTASGLTASDLTASER